MMQRTRWVWIAAALAAASLLSATPSPAQSGAAPAADGRELVVGTKIAPPFAMRDESGNWTGISIELWRHVADPLKWRYRFVEVATMPELLDGLSTGNFDVGVAAISVTAERQQTVDFSTPYFTAGTGVAVQSDPVTAWLPVVRSIVSMSFLQAILALLGLAITAGVLIWLFERKANGEFGGGVTHGLSTGVWWSTHTMTQRATGGAAPMTLPGRIIAMIWMVTSVIAIAVFTAGLTSALTTKRLHGVVNAATDLSSVRVGAVAGTSTEEELSRLRIAYWTMHSPQQGLKALRDGTIDAFVYDRPLLGWLIRQSGVSSIELTDLTMEPQNYAIALRNDSPLRKPLNVALLGATASDWWKDNLFRFLGAKR
jgi:polar amino acid transport system substrate-binding protein